MTIDWQIGREIARQRIEDTLRAARYSHHRAGLHRRPMRRVAAWVRWVSDRLATAAPRTHQAGTRQPLGLASAADTGPRDLRVTIFPLDGADGPGHLPPPGAGQWRSRSRARADSARTTSSRPSSRIRRRAGGTSSRVR